MTKHNVACFHCHQEIRHSLVAGENVKIANFDEPSPSSGTTVGHPPTLTFDCGYCHLDKHMGQLEMYSGKAASLGLPNMPSPMYLAEVDCIGCHYQKISGGVAEEFKGKTFKASFEACVKCHGPQFRGIMEETQLELETTLSKIAAKQHLVRAGLLSADLPVNERAAMQVLLAKARKWHDFVKYSKGEHNIYLASIALRKTDEALSRVAESAKISADDLSSLPLLNGSFCATMCHAKAGVRVPAPTVRHKGKTMPHLEHTQMLGGCVACHIIGPHKAVIFKGDGVCQGCHPK